MVIAALANAVSLALCLQALVMARSHHPIWSLSAGLGGVGFVLSYLSMAALLAMNFAVWHHPTAMPVRVWWSIACGVVGGFVFLLVCFLIIGGPL